MQSDLEGKPSLKLRHQQRLMWTGQQLDPDSPIYNMGFCIEIPVQIDEQNFRRAFSAVTSQSSSHRTVVQMHRGEPILEILSELPEFELEIVDFSERVDPEAEALAWCQARCRKLFDLSHRLFDSALIKLADEKFVWFMNHHHLISDAWSSTQLLRLVSNAYTTLANGEEVGRLNCEAGLESSEAELGNAIQAQSIQFYGAAADRLRSESLRMPVLFGDEAPSRDLDALVGDERAKSFSSELSRFNVLLALLFALLNRVSGQRDLCVGVPFHNRLTKPAKQSLGLFVSLHPVSVRVNNDDSFQTLFEKVRIASNKYLRAASTGAVTTGTNSKYNVIFNYINSGFGEFAGKPVRARWLHSGCHDREHHLRMHVENFGGQHEIKFDLNTGIFSDRGQNDIVGQFRTLLSKVAIDWDKPLSDIELVTDTQIEEYVASVDVDDVSTDTIAACFNRQVDAASDQVAISCGSRKLSYAELNQQAEQIAKRIVSLTARRQQRIAICLNRSIEAVAAILAVMKSGNAFLLLDPSWPDARLEHIVKDSAAACVITDSATQLPESLNSIRLNTADCLENSPDIVGLEPALNDSAYILYTSGSTGQPKGVEVSHASIAHYANWAVQFYGKGRPVSFPLFTPLTFDLTLTSIFVPLLSGGTIVVYEQQPGGHDTALLQVLQEDQVDVIKLTPSHLSLLAGQKYDSSRVKQLILGGEDLRAELARRTFGVFPDGLEIHNEYGPTEATVGCVVHSIDCTTRCEGSSVPIGKPIPVSYTHLTLPTKA